MTPRTGRSIIDGGIYHLLARSNNRQLVFPQDADCRRYLELLAAAAREHGLLVFHYALMPDHVHLILEASIGRSLSRAMHRLNLAYALHYRKRYGYHGHLWRGRFKSLRLSLDKRPTNETCPCMRTSDGNLRGRPGEENLNIGPVGGALSPWRMNRRYRSRRSASPGPRCWYQACGAITGSAAPAAWRW